MKQQKGDKKRKWTLSFWLQRLKVDRRIQMVCLFALAVAGILFVLNRYHTRYIRNLEYDSTAVTSGEVFDDLKQGTAEIGNTVWLPHFAADEPIYKRGSHYYIGEDYVQMQDGAPLFVNEGTYVNLVSGDGTLITSDWEEESAMAGMYVSNGQSFNFDGTMVEDEEILFLRMSNGLYLNTRELNLSGPQQKLRVPTNSFLYINENGVRYYARQDGTKMVYGIFSQTFEGSVEIGGQVMSFEEFLERLGIITGKEIEDIRRAEEEEETEPETTLGAANETNGAEETPETDEQHLEEDSSLEDAGMEQSSDTGGNGNNAAVSGEKDGSLEEETGNSRWDIGQEIPDFLNRPSGGKHHNYDWDNGNGSSGSWNSNQNSGSGWGTQNGTGSGAGNGSGNSTGTGGSGTGTGGSGTGTSGSGTGAGGSGTGTGGSGAGTGGSGTGTGNSGAGTGSTDGSGSENEKPVLPATGGNAEQKPNQPATGSNADKPATGGNAEPKPGEGGDGTGDGNGSGDGPTFELEWKKPEVSLSELETDVYSAFGNLEVTDSYGSFSRVSLAMAWDTTTTAKPNEDTSVQYRKTIKTKGSFQVDNLPPDTWIYVAAYLQYYDENGKRIKETDPFKTMLIKTETFSKVDHIYIQFSDDIKDSKEGRYYENQMSAYDLHLSSTNGYLLDKIYRGVIKVYSKDNKNQPITFNLSSSALKRHKLSPQDYVTLLSQNSLSPNQEYRYEFEFWDRFGNSFMESNKVCWGREESVTGADNYKAVGFDKSGTLYQPKEEAAWDFVSALGSERFWGYTHTSKTLPTAVIEQLPIDEIQTTLSKARISVGMKDIHNALIPDRALSTGTGSYLQITGDAPEGSSGKYKLYYGIYSNVTGTAVGQEINTKAVLSSDGKTIIIQKDETGSPYHYLDSTSLPSGDSSVIYQIEGLTAGENYMIRVFGTYDLNDNYAVGGVDQELGNMRFSTTSLASYGRIYYTFGSEHIHTEAPSGVETYDHERYESATAQRIRMTINTARTNATLAEVYYNRFLLKMRYRSGDSPFLQLEFNRDGDSALPGLINREIEVSESELDKETGIYTYVMKGLEDGKAADEAYDYRYQINGSDMKENTLPEITMEIPVTSLPDNIVEIKESNSGEKTYTFNLWDAFLSIDNTADGYAFAGGTARTTLYLTFGEGSLKSFTSYVIASESYAAQGGVESHDITSSSNAYRQCTFTTLKEMPFITIGGILQVGRYLYLVDIQFHDTDKSIYQGEVQFRNVNLTGNNATSTQGEYLDYPSSPDGGGQIEKVTFSSLRTGANYRLQIVPVDIRRTGGTGQPRIQNVSQKDYEYTVGKGVSGSIFLSGISYPLKELTEGEGETAAYRTISDYNKYEVGNFTYGSMSGSTGNPLTITAVDNYTYGVMDPISVNPGQIYYLHNLAGNTSEATTSVAFMDIDRNLAGSVKTIYSDSFIRIPDGVRYMQVQVKDLRNTGGRTNVVNLSQAQALLVYDDSDSVLKNKLKMVSAPIGDSGDTVTFTEEQLLSGDAIALTNGEWTSNLGNAAISLTYEFKDGNGVISSGTSNVYSGYVLKVPSGTVSATVNVNTKLYDAEKNMAAPDLRVINTGRIQVFSKYFFDTLISSYQAEVYDYSGSLNKDSLSGDVKLEVVAYDTSGNLVGAVDKAGLQGRVAQYNADGTNGYYEGNNNFETENGYTYRLSLSVCWRGDYYPLDEQEFTAQGNQYSITTGKQLLKMVTWPTGKFLVTADLGTIEPNTLTGLNQTFYGHLDGQGHSFDMKVTGGGTFLPALGSTGILENLEISETLGNSTANMSYVYPINTNSGAIRNVVIRMNTGIGNYRHSQVAGICYTNRGLIENFALYFTYPSASAGNYMSNVSGGIACYNAGNIRNGVVYGSRTLDVTTGLWGGSEEVGTGNVGGVAGVNQTEGTIEQVMVIMNMRVEHNANVLGPEAAMRNYGLIAGSNSGMVKNCFTNGEVNYGYWELNSNNVYQLRYTSGNNSIAWPGGNYSSSTSAKNCFYFSSGKYKTDNEYVSYQSGTTALRSPKFYDATVNSQQGFIVESQLAGEYYPIISMPECMDGLQTNIPLTAALPGNMPVYLSTAVLKQDQEDMRYLEEDVLSAELVKQLKAMAASDKSIAWEDYFTEQEDGSAVVVRQFALANISISNKLGYVLDNVQIKNLNTTVLAESTSSDISSLTVLVTPYLKNMDGELQLSTRADSFTSSYQLESFDYGYTATAMRTSTLTDASFALELYYPLSAQTWDTAPAGPRVNYRVTQDIQFRYPGGSFENESVRRKALTFFSETNNCGSMGGIFDGNHHTFDFADTTISYYFREILAGGEVRNLNVENLRLAGVNNTTYIGFVRMADAKSYLSGIHMRNVTLDNAYQYAGPLAAYASTGTIENCTIAGAKVTSGSNTNTLYAGGMIGYKTGGGLLRNSFVRDLDMSIMDGVTVGGVGGLVGYHYASSSISYARITSCYVQGKIQTAFANCGGLFGIGNGQISAVWTAVDIIGTNNMGSLAGYAMATGDWNLNSYASAVVSGELYSSTQAVSRRLIGTWERTPLTNLWTYAYEGQLLNSNTSREAMDVSDVVDAETMMSYYYWTDMVGIGDGFCLYGAEGIRDVAKAPVYPILYETDGTTILPDQVEISYQVIRPDFEVVQATAKNMGITNNDPYGEYQLELTAKIEGAISGTSGDNLKPYIKADGLDFSDGVFTVEVKTESGADGKPVQATYVTISGMKATSRFDSYRMDYEYEPGKTVSTKLEFVDEQNQPVYLYWMISNSAEWENKMKECGHRYENFMICNDIDLSASQTTQLKLNRLIGKKKTSDTYVNRSKEWTSKSEFYQLSGMSISKAYGAWIAEIATYMGYLDIRNCTLIGDIAVEKFGLVGNVVGDLEYVDFYNNTIMVGSGGSTYNYLGCIGYIGNNVSKVRLSKITIGSNAGDAYYYSYVGGLTGYARTLEEVYAFDCSISMGNATTSINRSYFGGIAGYVPTDAHLVYGEKLKVTGRNSTGGLIGWLYQSTADDTILEKPDLEAISVEVKGTQSVGGLVGSSGSNGNFKNMRVIDSTVLAYTSNAGGITGHGSYGAKTNLEVYGSQVTANENYAGGICGVTYGYINKSKMADCTIKAGGNYAGGISAGPYAPAYQNAVYGGSVSAKAYAGGIVGYVVNSNASGIGAGKNIYQNVVSGTSITAETSYAGGVVGAVCGALLYENEVMETTKVNAVIGSGGLVGYSSGGVMRNNIIGAEVKGTNNVGGLAGQILGYGVSFSVGTVMENHVAKAYGNLIACTSISGSGNYIAGVAGLYEPGDEPIDGDGNVIPNSGYTEWMSNQNFYGNAILADKISADNVSSKRVSWYANYTGDSQNYLTHEQYPRYDCVIETLASNYNLALPNLTVGTKVMEQGAVSVPKETLGTKEFYTNSNENGGLGFKESDYDWSGLKEYYPYIGNGTNGEISLIPYQKKGQITVGNGRDWNTYFKNNTGAGGTWTETKFDGHGIPNPAAQSTRNLSSVARGLVYPSGINTINIDFSDVDTSFVTFEIVGYLDETSIDTLENSSWVCSLAYDYETNFVLNLYSLDHSVKETYSYRAVDLQNTVMNWNGKNYYLRSDGVYQGREDGSSTCVLEGTYVNLYQGQALKEDGQVYDLSTGEPDTGKERK